MFKISGKYNTADVFIDEVEESALAQIINLLNQPFAQGSKICIMPDVHAGAGCVIGFTARVTDKIVANLVGVDIGCGMLTVNLVGKTIDFGALDAHIRRTVPLGFEIHASPIAKDTADYTLSRQLRCYNSLRKQETFDRSVGTLGGGNHFIEIAGGERDLYLVVHSGSRNLGKQVAEHYQALAIEDCKGSADFKIRLEHTIENLKKIGEQKKIAKTIKQMKEEFAKSKPSIPAELCYLEGEHLGDYLYDMRIAQAYAAFNRRTIANSVLSYFGTRRYHDFVWFETVHNYIDLESMILRKGAVRALEGEPLIIPINMRDGSLLCSGKGNPDWNFSAPHGAGRVMSRGEAKRTLQLSDYEETMRNHNVYSTSVNADTLDESPMAYKSMETIINAIGDTVTVNDVIYPIYNIKAGGE